MFSAARKKDYCPALTKRKNRIKQLLEALEVCESKRDKKDNISLKQFTARFSIETGVTKEKISEYLNTLFEAGYIEIDEAKDIIKRC